ncbi:MAG: DUF6495 family protein [Flavobacteriaceae bacterium]|jgi:hypothetical protein|nr:DUF6495 family protein [Flavobacteriaceae bacterium]
MKYMRLTKEQFESLHQEFANFLATQSIDKNEWEEIKKNRLEIAEQELDVFSDLIWEGVLNQTNYLDHFSKNFIFLFSCKENEMESIILKTTDTDVDFMTVEGLQWMTENLFSEQMEIHHGIKKYTDDRNVTIFNIIREGAVLSDGNLFRQFQNIINE